MSAVPEPKPAALPVLEACALAIGHGQRHVGVDLNFAMATGEVLCLSLIHI